ncbi:DUF305 domain-containing protein [Nocardioides sp.]|uniref:DUF305 domain-containing protein n=1 Tax=Nocardioides sp. TaxID=35761 RepID=UPI0035B25571
MRRTTVAAVAVAALVGVGAGAAVTAYDGSDGHRPMASAGWHDGHQGIGPGSGMGRGMGQHASVASEKEFLAEMVAHHQEAIRAARELARSDRADLRDFGERIVADQSAQVDRMEGWLDDWYADGAGDVDYEPMMRDLSGLTGDRLDRTFLEDMVWHHMAAVMMAQHLLVSGLVEHDEVAALARDIRDDQRAEIRQMRRWLADWFA